MWNKQLALVELGGWVIMKLEVLMSYATSQRDLFCFCFAKTNIIEVTFDDDDIQLKAFKPLVAPAGTI